MSMNNQCLSGPQSPLSSAALYFGGPASIISVDYLLLVIITIYWTRGSVGPRPEGTFLPPLRRVQQSSEDLYTLGQFRIAFGINGMIISSAFTRWSLAFLGRRLWLFNLVRNVSALLLPTPWLSIDQTFRSLPPQLDWCRW